MKPVYNIGGPAQMLHPRLACWPRGKKLQLVEKGLKVLSIIQLLYSLQSVPDESCTVLLYSPTRKTQDNNNRQMTNLIPKEGTNFDWWLNMGASHGVSFQPLRRSLCLVMPCPIWNIDFMGTHGTTLDYKTINVTPANLVPEWKLVRYDS